MSEKKIVGDCMEKFKPKKMQVKMIAKFNIKNRKKIFLKKNFINISPKSKIIIIFQFKKKI